MEASVEFTAKPTGNLAFLEALTKNKVIRSITFVFEDGAEETYKGDVVISKKDDALSFPPEKMGERLNLGLKQTTTYALKEGD